MRSDNFAGWPSPLRISADGIGLPFSLVSGPGAGADGTVKAVHVTEGQEGVDAGMPAVEIG